MLVKINSFYKIDIDRAKNFVIKKDYTLNKPKVWLLLSIVGILFSIFTLSMEINFIGLLVYTIPLIVTLSYELYLIRAYKKLIQYEEVENSENIIKIILKILMIRMTNALLSPMCFIPIIISTALDDIMNYDTYLDMLNKYSVLAYILVIFISMITFKIGKIAGRNYLRKNREKILANKKTAQLMAPVIKSSVAACVILFRRFPYFIEIITIGIPIISIFLPFTIGENYFTFKHFNKLVEPNDTFMDYEF